MLRVLLLAVQLILHQLSNKRNVSLMIQQITIINITIGDIIAADDVINSITIIIIVIEQNVNVNVMKITLHQLRTSVIPRHQLRQQQERQHQMLLELVANIQRVKRPALVIPGDNGRPEKKP